MPTHTHARTHAHTHTRTHAHTHTRTAQPKKPLDKSSCLFESLHFFLSSLSPHGLESAACVIQPGATHVFMPSEGETYNRAKCGVGVRVLKFTAALLKHPTELKTVSAC